MRRYIDADKLKDNFCGACATPKRYQRTFEQCQNHRDTYGNRCFKMRLIDTTPTADVVEVRHGEWYIREYEFFTCSECGFDYWNGCDYTVQAKERLANGEHPNYCPNCGAKMDGEERK